MKQLICTACGSPYITIEGNMLICQSCDSRFVREPAREPERPTSPPPTKGDPIRENTVREGFFPFAHNEAETRKSFHKWLIMDDWAPDDILLSAQLTSLEAIYVPAYFFDVEYSASWRASVGYDRSESSTDANGNVTWTTVTDWHLQNGTTNGIAIVGEIASKDSRLGALHIEKAPGWIPLDQFQGDRNQLLPFNVDQLAALSAAMPNIKTQASATIAGTLPGDRYSDLQFDLSVGRHDLEKLYFPFYLATYIYGGQTYTVILDGRNEGVGFAESRPKCEDLKKAGNGYLKLIWIPVIPSLLAILFVGLPDVFGFDTLRSLPRLADFIISALIIASLITVPIALIVGFVARWLFKVNGHGYRTAVKQVINNDPVDLDQLCALEKNRTRQRQRTKWMQCLWALFLLLTIFAIAAFSLSASPYIQRRLEEWGTITTEYDTGEAADTYTAEEILPWVTDDEIIFLLGTLIVTEVRDEIGTRLYELYGDHLHSVNVRTIRPGEDLQISVGFRPALGTNRFQEAVINARDIIETVVIADGHDVFEFYVILLDETDNRVWQAWIRRLAHTRLVYFIGGDETQRVQSAPITPEQIQETLYAMQEAES